MTKRWLAVALRPAVVRRSVTVALVVGTALVAINQGDRLIAGQGLDLMKALLTYLVPYGVATYGAVSALLGRGDGPE
ncbi:nitrate/nitrite transporter NrtS [Pelagibius sp.]|uniref:nitrate/nitrite transporter NrtS n=1 Tax=Pelagibius sp. TaxID=1931238 RepID=UPI00260E3C8C|nr:nitrate/nitrite transporter NrtS [Pelagibius sp.]